MGKIGLRTIVFYVSYLVNWTYTKELLNQKLAGKPAISWPVLSPLAMRISRDI
jgi:uncharacterized membrane protein (DUF485 family)